MNDIFNQQQAKRLFAFIAAGGTAGALTGPVITTTLVGSIGLSYLLLISACILSLTVPTIILLTRTNFNSSNIKNAEDNRLKDEQFRNKSLKGSIWGGFTLIIKSPYLLGISVFIILYAVSITFVQITQAQLIEAAYSQATERTKLFSKIDFAVNALTLIFQIFLTSRLISWLGYRTTLLLIPLGITLGFGLIAATPALAIIIGVEIFRRSGDYAIMKPAREMLFSVVSREEKYKAKNVIDTAILRTGNTSSAWLYTGLKSLGAGGASIAGISVIIGACWCAVTIWLGSQFKKRKSNNISN